MAKPLSPRTIKRIRKRRGWTQKKLAMLLNVSIRTVSRWETGESSPRPNSDQSLRYWL